MVGPSALEQHTHDPGTKKHKTGGLRDGIHDAELIGKRIDELAGLRSRGNLEIRCALQQVDLEVVWPRLEAGGKNVAEGCKEWRLRATNSETANSRTVVGWPGEVSVTCSVSVTPAGKTSSWTYEHDGPERARQQRERYPLVLEEVEDGRGSRKRNCLNVAELDGLGTRKVGSQDEQKRRGNKR